MSGQNLFEPAEQELVDSIVNFVRGLVVGQKLAREVEYEYLIETWYGFGRAAGAFSSGMDIVAARRTCPVCGRVFEIHEMLIAKNGLAGFPYHERETTLGTKASCAGIGRVWNPDRERARDEKR